MIRTKFMRISNKITCVFFIGLLFFAFAGCDHSTSSSSRSNSEEDSKIYIGTKKPSQAKSVGDIVFNDGSASPSNEEFTDAQKAAAVAVIFDETNKLGVGLNTAASKKQWNSYKAIAYTSGVRYATSQFNGKANTDEIADLSDYDAEKYPAFYFCTTYSAAGFTSGWYLPAIDELQKLYDNIDAVGEAFTALGKPDPFASNQYWSSSQDETFPSAGMGIGFGFERGFPFTCDSIGSFFVCAIREF
jgi:hypothetical protein